MIGVSGPLNTHDRGGATRFIAGLAFGAGAITLLLAAVVATVASLTATLAPSVRAAVAAPVLLVLASLDLLDRTPQLGRQVPQRFARVLDPGVRGIFWGADLATMISTRKTSSLVWVALFVLPVLGHPGTAAAGVLVANGVFVLGIAVQAKVRRASLMRGSLGAVNITAKVRLVRRVTGVLTLLSAIPLVSWGLG